MNTRTFVRLRCVAVLGAVLTFAGCLEGPAVSHTGSTLDQVRSLAAQTMGIDASKIRGATSLGELGADDLDFVELVLLLEQHFNISIPDETADELLGDDSQSGLKRVTMSRLAAIVDSRK